MRRARSGLTDRGTLAVGQRADIALWDIAMPAELCYWIGGNRCRGIGARGASRREAE
jgi:imidazolonepropionase